MHTVLGKITLAADIHIKAIEIICVKLKERTGKLGLSQLLEVDLRRSQDKPTQNHQRKQQAQKSFPDIAASRSCPQSKKCARSSQDKE